MSRSSLFGYILTALFARLPILRNRHFLLLDALILCVTPSVALWLRIEDRESIFPYLGALLPYTVGALIIRIGVFYGFGLYNRYWRYATVDELVQISLAVLTSAVVVSFGVFLWKLQSISIPLPRSLPLLDSLLALLLVGGIRFSVRFGYRLQRQPPTQDAAKLLIVGAGDVGQIIVKELQCNGQLGLNPVAFLDDDPHKQGMHIMGLPVLGPRTDLPEVVEQLEIAQVLIAMPRAGGKTIRSVLELCEAAGVAARIVPSMNAILDNRVSVNHIRKVEIEDLLRREPIQTDIAGVSALIRGKRVLITGGGGSIGSELCRQVLSCNPGELALLGHGENSIFEIHNELQKLVRQTGGDAEQTVLHALLADIRFPDRIRSIVARFQPDIIFHAAAHKHVPLMEMHPAEAITNNVLGTRNVLNAALAAGVERFVLVSTDKAVNPTSVMGASKRVAELLVLEAARRTGRAYVAVRFGNVLGSRGSVLLTFRKQIAAGGPITVSHPEMKRYFMTIPEAVQLVLQASVLGKGGEIFVLDMGEPVRIVDLAQDLIELSGLQVGRDVDIVFSGIRPGEKLFEELFVPGERYQRTHHEKVLIAQNASTFVPERMDEMLERLSRAAEEVDEPTIRRYLRRLVPEFQTETDGTQEAVESHGAALREPMDELRVAAAANHP